MGFSYRLKTNEDQLYGGRNVAINTYATQSSDKQLILFCPFNLRWQTPLMTMLIYFHFIEEVLNQIISYFMFCSCGLFFSITQAI